MQCILALLHASSHTVLLTRNITLASHELAGELKRLASELNLLASKLNLLASELNVHASELKTLANYFEAHRVELKTRE